MTKGLKNLVARAVSQAKMMGLRSVVPHALFVVTHQALGDEANRLLREAGVGAAAYCQKLFTELTAMLRVKRYDGEIPVHEVTRRILERAAAAESDGSIESAARTFAANEKWPRGWHFDRYWPKKCLENVNERNRL